MIEDSDSWEGFRLVAITSPCWWCGRTTLQRPQQWYAPFIIERAHVVNKPRRLDRRVAVLLCSRCHKLEHGEQFGNASHMIERPTLPELLWLKRAIDPEFWDRAYMQANSVQVLPRARKPKALGVEFSIKRLIAKE